MLADLLVMHGKIYERKERLADTRSQDVAIVQLISEGCRILAIA